VERAEGEGARGEIEVTAYTVLDAPQRSAEWYAARVGRLTGSSAADALAFKKTGDKSETADRAKLRARLVAERLTGRALDDDAFITRELQRGIDKEGDAAIAYEAATGLMVRWSGFLSHNSLMVGCSLDGHVGDPLVGIVEIKCPKSTTHLGYLQGGCVPDDYRPQATHNLWVSGAEWLDIAGYAEVPGGLMALSPELRGVNSYLRDVNADRRDRIFPSRPDDVLPLVARTPEETARAFVAEQRPAWLTHDPKGSYCVSYRGALDRAGSSRVHRAQTAHDLVRFLRDGLRFPVVIDRIWEDELAVQAGSLYEGWHCKDCGLEVQKSDLVIVNEDAEMNDDSWQDLTTVAHKVCPPED
jgi:hypothetical protein